MKIHIVGCSGTGKTYLAKKLSAKYAIPCFDLDHLQWDDTAEYYGVKRPVETRDAMLQDILKQKDWIIEGVYYSWVLQSFAEADVIYVLDMPRYLYRFRIWRRFVRRKLGLEKGKKETLKSLRALLQWTDKFQRVNLEEIKKLLAHYGKKVVYIKNTKEINALI